MSLLLGTCLAIGRDSGRHSHYFHVLTDFFQVNFQKILLCYLFNKEILKYTLKQVTLGTVQHFILIHFQVIVWNLKEDMKTINRQVVCGITLTVIMKTF